MPIRELRLHRIKHTHSHNLSHTLAQLSPSDEREREREAEEEEGVRLGQLGIVGSLLHQQASFGPSSRV